MKTLHIIGESEYGGGTVYTFSILKRLEKEGHSVSLLSTNGETIEEAGKLGIPVVSHISIGREINIIRDLKALVQLIRYLKSENYDIVHTHTSKGGFVGRIAARLAGVPRVVHTIHGFYFTEDSSLPKKIIYGTLEKIAGWFGHVMITVNNEDREMAVKHHIVNRKKIVTIYNGVDLDSGRVEEDSSILEHPKNGDDKTDFVVKENICAQEVKIKKEDVDDNEVELENEDVCGKEVELENEDISSQKKELRKEFNISQEDILIGIVGRLHWEKGHLYAIEAMKKLVEEYPSIKLVIIGKGPDEELFRSKVKELLLESTVIFTGFRKDVIDWLDVLDIFLLPSLREGMSITLLEAMAKGKPIICTDIRGNREVIKDGINGLLVKPKDPKDIIDKIRLLLDDRKLAKGLAAQAQKDYGNTFTEKIMLDKIMDVYFK